MAALGAEGNRLNRHSFQILILVCISFLGYNLENRSQVLVRWSAGKSICQRTWRPEFNPWDQGDGRRKLTGPSHTRGTYAHTPTQSKQRNV